MPSCYMKTVVSDGMHQIKAGKRLIISKMYNDLQIVVYHYLGDDPGISRSAKVMIQEYQGQQR